MDHQRPWPEAIGGAIIGLMLAMGIAFIPALSRLFDSTGGILAVLAVGALVGALTSWWIAGRSIRKIVQAEEVVARDLSAAETRRRHAA
jgi:hypothetical protein